MKREKERERILQPFKANQSYLHKKKNQNDGTFQQSKRWNTVRRSTSALDENSFQTRLLFPKNLGRKKTFLIKQIFLCHTLSQKATERYAELKGESKPRKTCLQECAVERWSQFTCICPEMWTEGTPRWWWGEIRLKNVHKPVKAASAALNRLKRLTQFDTRVSMQTVHSQLCKGK